MTIQYVSKDTAPLYKEKTGSGEILELLWGDHCDILPGGGTDRAKVRARGKGGFVDKSALGDESLLEIYFIDVGQGDGVLIRMPDGRHVLIDGGYKRESQPSGRNAADFVDWKFAKDYRKKQIELDAMISSHCDADHYGGLWDLINPDEVEELDLATVKVGAFYHAGVSWWTEEENKRWLGPKQDGYLKRLLEDHDSATNATKDTGSGPKLQGEWGKFIKCVVDMYPEIKFQRLSHVTEYVPGFGPDDGAATLRVLGPVEFELGGKAVLKSLGNDSQNTNGNSVLLRLDYRRTRTLLTGDLNAKSQQVLLDHYTGERQEFASDVAKACHHGSDDCSYEFLSVVGAAATVISSGDNEGHAHPRPSIVAASAQTGHTRIKNDKVVTPLIYSTEIARSIRIGRAYEITAEDYPAGSGTVDVKLTDKSNAEVHFKETAAGDLKPRKRSKSIEDLYVVGGIIYGLVNVRTDGSKILCATLNEKSNTWDVKTFESRF